LSTRKPKKLAEGMNIYITELDFYRTPITLGLIPWPFRVYISMGFKLTSEYYFKGHNKDLFRKLERIWIPFIKNFKIIVIPIS